MPTGTWSRAFGTEIDQAARDGQRSIVARSVVAAGSAVFLAANVGILIGAVWMTLNLLTEAAIWAATRHQMAGRSGTRLQRTNFLVATALMTANWSATTVLYWLSTRHGLPMVGIIVATGQLIHAQAFAFRSKAILAITAGIPAVTLTVLVLFLGDLHGSTLGSAAFALILMLGYVAASARANMKAAESLRAAYDEVQGIAYFDPLTSLANRRLFDNEFTRLMAFSDQRAGQFALLIVDLDGLKRVNDRFGHDAGDALLIESAERLRKLIRVTDALARIGGDEFAILLADIGEINDVEVFCERLVEAFGAPIRFRGATLRCTPSVGAALYPADGLDQSSVFKAADLALYAAKNGGRNTWRRFTVALQAA